MSEKYGPLPEPFCDDYLWGADQMRAYAEQAAAAGRERCAKLCAALRLVGEWEHRGYSVSESYDDIHGSGAWEKLLSGG